jgi:hypothetical protein
MPGLVPGIHVFLCEAKTWMAGTSPAMTKLNIGLLRGACHRAALCADPLARNYD